MSNTRPDWTLSCMNKETDEKAPIGGGWNNPDGSITIVFNPFVKVPVGKEFGVRLFKRREDSVGGTRTPPDKDEIPF